MFVWPAALELVMTRELLGTLGHLTTTPDGEEASPPMRGPPADALRQGFQWCARELITMDEVHPLPLRRGNLDDLAPPVANVGP